MEQIKNNKIFWALVIFTVFNVGFFFLSNLIVERSVDRVIFKLQKEYSPSPYGPGFDPDKVNPSFFDANKKQLEIKKYGENKVARNESLRQVDGKLAIMTASSDNWLEEWESSRGINP